MSTSAAAIVFDFQIHSRLRHLRNDSLGRHLADEAASRQNAKASLPVHATSDCSVDVHLQFCIQLSIVSPLDAEALLALSI